MAILKQPPQSRKDDKGSSESPQKSEWRLKLYLIS